MKKFLQNAVQSWRDQSTAANVLKVAALGAIFVIPAVAVELLWPGSKVTGVLAFLGVFSVLGAIVFFNIVANNKEFRDRLFGETGLENPNDSDPDEWQRNI